MGTDWSASLAEGPALRYFENFQRCLATEVHGIVEPVAEFLKCTGVFQVEEFAAFACKFDSSVCCGMIPLCRLEAGRNLGCSRRICCGFFRKFAFIGSGGDAEFDGVGPVFNPGNHVKFLCHGEVFSETNHVLQLVKVVAGGRDGSLLCQIMAARETKLRRDFHARFTCGTIHAAHGGDTLVTPFEWCVG